MKDLKVATTMAISDDIETAVSFTLEFDFHPGYIFVFNMDSKGVFNIWTIYSHTSFLKLSINCIPL
ncbi:MAG: hypothetical protein KJP00_00970, partial [Bacteroidia bacterium]|nr:hypothetical protein [Bacteroidia bacterium]